MPKRLPMSDDSPTRETVIADILDLLADMGEIPRASPPLPPTPRTSPRASLTLAPQGASRPERDAAFANDGATTVSSGFSPNTSPGEVDDMAQCNSFTENGTRCRMASRKGSAHCMVHDPEYADTQRQNNARGGANSRIKERQVALDMQGVSMEDRRSIQLVIDALFRLIATGQIPRDQRRDMLRALTLAVRNFDMPARKTKLDAVHVEHRDYKGAQRMAIDVAFAAAIEFARGEDLQRLADEMSAESGHRTKKARDLEDFPVLLPANHPEARANLSPGRYKSAADYAPAIGEKWPA